MYTGVGVAHMQWGGESLSERHIKEQLQLEQIPAYCYATENNRYCYARKDFAVPARCSSFPLSTPMLGLVLISPLSHIHILKNTLVRHRHPLPSFSSFSLPLLCPPPFTRSLPSIDPPCTPHPTPPYSNHFLPGLTSPEPTEVCHGLGRSRIHGRCSLPIISIRPEHDRQCSSC